MTSINYINLIKLIKRVKYGRIEIIIKNGEPTDVRQIIQNVKLDEPLEEDLRIDVLD